MARKCLDFLSALSRIIPTCGMMLFCILVHLIVLHLQSIRSAIEQQMIVTNRLPTKLLLESRRWTLNFKLKRYYLQVAKTICIIDKYFGIPLLAEVVYVFIGVTNCIMFVFISAISGDSLLGLVNIAFGLENTMHLLLITSFSDRISNEVFNFDLIY